LCRRPVAIDLALDLLGQTIQFISRAAQRFGFIPQHARRRLLDTLMELRDAFGRFALGLSGLIGETSLDELLAGVQRLVGLLLTGLADGVVKLLGQQRLGLLGVVDRLVHLVHQMLELLFLLTKILGDLVARRGGTERRLFVIVHLRELLRKLLLLLVKLTRILAHLRHCVIELTRSTLAELIP
jgi:hypothetical protein